MKDFKVVGNRANGKQVVRRVVNLKEADRVITKIFTHLNKKEEEVNKPERRIGYFEVIDLRTNQVEWFGRIFWN